MYVLSISYISDDISISSNSCSPHSVHSPSTKLCPFAGIVCCATNISPHTEQCFPSVSPSSVHVASFPLSITSVCPFAGIVCCSTNISPHTEQCFPSVFPSSVHVGSTAWSTTSVCPNAGIVSCSTVTALHTEQCFPSVNPSSVHVASFPSSITSVQSSVKLYPHTVQLALCVPFPLLVLFPYEQFTVLPSYESPHEQVCFSVCVPLLLFT